MLAPLVNGRYRNGFDDERYAVTVLTVRRGWLRRMIAILFNRKR